MIASHGAPPLGLLQPEVLLLQLMQVLLLLQLLLGKKGLVGLQAGHLKAREECTVGKHAVRGATSMGTRCTRRILCAPDEHLLPER